MNPSSFDRSHALIDISKYNLYVVFMFFDEVLSLPEGPQRTAATAAWVQGLFSEESQTPVLVGGAAVEILTGGAYTTGDSDFVGSVPTSVRRKLESLEMWANNGPSEETR